MRNYIVKIAVYILSICLFSSCSSWQKRGAKELKKSPTEVSLDKAIDLRLKAKKGDVYHHDYYVMSVSRTYDDESIAREKEEITDFKVRQRVQEAKDGAIQYSVEVLEKNGVMDLHDLVMPYVGEKLRVRLNPYGKVLEVDGYDESSAFYLSPVSLPKEAVKVGDTWTLTEEWRSEKNAMPMRIDLVSIFKNVYRYNDRLFADIETSGEIQVPSLVKQKIGFHSIVKGRILLDIESGNVVWSEIRNEESLEYPSVRIEVKSCMELKARKPKKLNWPWALKPKCNPREEFVQAIPGV